MKRIFLFVAWIIIVNTAVSGQDKYFTKTGRVSFAGKSPLSSVNAENKAVSVVLDTKTGVLQFSLLTKGFEFKRELMQKHFNEKYIESDKFPKSEFKGEIINNPLVKFSTDGVYPVTATGKLTIHGVEKERTEKGTITIKNGQITLDCIMNIAIKDFNIEIPKLVIKNIAEVVAVKIKVDYTPYVKK